MSFFHPLAGAALGSLLIVAVHAAAPAEDPGLTLTEALARVSDGDPRLAARAWSVRAADALREQAGLRPLPTLGVEIENFAGTGPLGGFDSAEATVQASQTLERGDKRARREALASREHETARSLWSADLADARAATALAFVEVLSARERLRLAREQLDLARDGAADARARVKAAAASAADEARAEVALALAKSVVTRAEASLANARAALAARWGSRPEEIGELVGALSVPDALPEPADLMPRLADHPRLAWRRAGIEGGRAELRLEQARAAGDITVGGGVKFFRDGRDAALVAGFSLPLPVRHPNQGAIRAARENLAGAEQLALADELDLRVELGAAWRELQAARDAALGLRRDALPAATRAHDLLRGAHERGEAALFEVLDARAALASVHRELVDAEAACAAAAVRVDALTDQSFPLTRELLSDR